MIEIFERLTELLRQGKTVAMASIISTSGSTPRAPLARLPRPAARGGWPIAAGGTILGPACLPEKGRAP